MVKGKCVTDVCGDTYRDRRHPYITPGRGLELGTSIGCGCITTSQRAVVL